MKDTTSRFKILDGIRRFVGINLKYVEIRDWNGHRINKTFHSTDDLVAALFDLSMKKDIVNIWRLPVHEGCGLRIVVRDPVHVGNTNIDAEVMGAISRLNIEGVVK